MVVDDLHQSVPGGQIGPFAFGGHLFQILIALLGSGQGVVAVAHGEQQRRRAAHTVLLLHLRIGAQAHQSLRHAVHLAVRQLPALQMAAALLQVKVVQLLHVAAGGSQGFDDGFIRVVDQQHDVGKLYGSVLPHLHPGRDAGEDRPLRGPDQCAGAGGEVILVQVHHTDEAVADLAVGLGALDVDEGAGQGLEHAVVQILLHGRVDGGDIAVHIGAVELSLRQDQPQGGGSVPDGVLHRLPVFRLRGELVAGHHGPLGHVRVLGQQDVRGVKAKLVEFLVHTASPFLI